MLVHGAGSAVLMGARKDADIVLHVWSAILEQWPASVREAFTITPDLVPEDTLTIRCNGCKARWSYPQKEPTAGTVLSLLEHAASHDGKRREPGLRRGR